MLLALVIAAMPIDRLTGSATVLVFMKLVGMQSLTMNSRRIWLGTVLILVLLLALAWYDGGEEPLREIVSPVELPEAMR